MSEAPGELERLNDGALAEASERLRRCCGARRWVEAMLRRRPFRSREHVLRAAEEAFAEMGPEDWREAFAQHPRIGDDAAVRALPRAEAAWSAGEQAGAATADALVREALALGNHRYDERFGYAFIVCATGRTAEEMLAMLEARLANDPERELRNAAEEQMKITRIRLDKLLAESGGA
jgi:2-oxo-4-hydroxy-4-carboxy-5-ureidoimidazoline decarboxylase